MYLCSSHYEHHTNYTQAIDSSIDGVLQSETCIHGSEKESFEQKFARFARVGIHYPMPTHRQMPRNSSVIGLRIADIDCRVIRSLRKCPEPDNTVDSVCSAALDYYKSE